MVKLTQTDEVDKEEEAVIIENQEPTEMKFSCRYMNMFTKATPLSTQVHISMMDEHPMAVEYNIPKFGYIRFYLASLFDDSQNWTDSPLDHKYKHSEYLQRQFHFHTMLFIWLSCNLMIIWFFQSFALTKTPFLYSILSIYWNNKNWNSVMMTQNKVNLFYKTHFIDKALW